MIKRNSKKFIGPIAVVGVAIALVVGVVVALIFNSDASRQCVYYGHIEKEHCIQDYIGLTKDQATAKAEENSLIIEIYEPIDGVNYVITDLGGPRVILQTKDGIVVDGLFTGY